MLELVVSETMDRNNKKEEVQIFCTYKIFIPCKLNQRVSLLLPLFILAHQPAQLESCMCVCPYMLTAYYSSIIRKLIPKCCFWRCECAQLHVSIRSVRSKSGSRSV